MKRLALGLFLALIAYAQQSAFQKVLSAVTVATASAPVQNSGQGSHQITLFVTSTGAGSCSGTVQLEYSWDAVTWIAFPGLAVQSFNFLFSAATTQNYNFSATGIFPEIRLNLTTFTSSGTSCSATAFYAGNPPGSVTIQPVAPSGVAFQPITNYSTVGTAIVNIPNSGQSYHQITASLVNIGGQTCAATDSYMLSLSGVTTSNFTNFITSTVLQGSGLNGIAENATALGAGSYQALSLTATQTGSPGTHCILNVYYSGNFSSLPAVSTYQPGNASTLAVPFPVPLTQCALNQPIAVAAAATTSIIPLPGNGVGTRVCQVVLTTPTAAAIATISSGASGGCASLLTLGTYNMAVGVPIAIGSALGNVFTLPAGRAFCVGATTGNVNGSVSYDFQ